MQVYKNSPIREEIRLKYYNEARRQEDAINAKLQQDLARLGHESPKGIDGYFKLAGVVFVLCLMMSKFNLGFAAFAAIAVLVGAWALNNQGVKERNEKKDDERIRLTLEAEHRVADAYAQADAATQREVAAYDNRVNAFRSSCKPANIARIADHTANVFLQAVAIGEKNAGNFMQFVELDFVYNVFLDRIEYTYDGITHIADTFSFTQQRYKQLNDTAEAEGLAAVLMKGTLGKLRPQFQGKFAKVSNSHQDALVTIHFRMPNPNFVPTTSFN